MMSQMGGVMGAEENPFANLENMGAMMQMMGGFTVLRLTKLMGAANVDFSKEQLLGLNAQLNKIKK